MTMDRKNRSRMPPAIIKDVFMVHPFHVVADGGFGNHSFIIPHVLRKNKREMPEMQGKTPSFPLTSCPEPAGQGETASGVAVKKLK